MSTITAKHFQVLIEHVEIPFDDNANQTETYFSFVLLFHII